MTEPQYTKGGAGWELGQAATRMVQAMLHDDAAEMEAAMSDYAAALGSQATSSMAALAAPLMAGLIEVKNALTALDAHSAKRDRAQLDRNAHFQDQLDVRLDVIFKALDPIAEIVMARPAQRAQEKAENDARHVQHELRLDAHDKDIAQIKQHLGLDGEV